MYWTASFSLNDARALSNPIPSLNITNLKADQVTGAQLAINCKIEKREVSLVGN
jgi:hypothetical protein